MYAGVPIVTPMPVKLDPSSDRCRAFATPKSVTTAWPLVEQNVLGLDVPVDDVLMVCGRQRVGDLTENHECITDRDRALAR